MSDKQKTVLIVDDEESLRGAIANVLKQEGYTVLLAGDGEEGLKVALEEEPDLILLDIVMPKKDGVTVLKELREDGWGMGAKVIVMTVLDDLEKIAEVLEEGGNEYILKTDISLANIAEKVKARIG